MSEDAAFKHRIGAPRAVATYLGCRISELNNVLEGRACRFIACGRAWPLAILAPDFSVNDVTEC